MLLIVGTLLVAAPVVDFRYAYAIVLSMPIWGVISFSESIVRGETEDVRAADQ